MEIARTGVLSLICGFVRRRYISVIRLDDSAVHEMNLYPMPAARFEMNVWVTSAGIDQQNHVNTMVYLRWVQDVATAHWRAIASATAKEATIRTTVIDSVRVGKCVNVDPGIGERVTHARKGARPISEEDSQLSGCFYGKLLMCIDAPKLTPATV